MRALLPGVLLAVYNFFAGNKASLQPVDDKK
jgi:hypothetical protein